MDHHKVFSTNIFVLDNFLTESVYIGIKKYIELLWKERTPVSKWQSTSDLHTKPAFGPFVNLILDSTKEILKALDYQETHIEITDMWATVLKPGEMHMPHTHSNNFLSGVYYLHSSQGASIMFRDQK